MHRRTISLPPISPSKLSGSPPTTFNSGPNALAKAPISFSPLRASKPVLERPLAGTQASASQPAAVAEALDAATSSAIASLGRVTISEENRCREASTSGERLQPDVADISLDDLEQLGQIGSGSSGVVVKVRDRASGRTLVLKKIQFDFKSDQLRKQVMNELRTLYGADHPHIVR